MTGIAKDYASALFMLAAEENRVDDFARDMLLVQEMFAQNPEYVALLGSPALSAEEVEEIIANAFGDSVAEQVLFFLNLLCRRGHIQAIDDCAKEFDALYKTSKQISSAKVVSAAPLSDKQLDALKSKLEAIVGNAVEIQCSVDETIMGGMTVTVDGKLLDGSLKRRLNEVKEVISK